MEMIDGPLTGHTYCNDRLTVLGYVSHNRHGKRYLVHCPVCAEDSEQYGEGNFESYDSNIKKGAVPCGCSKGYRPTDAQLSLRLERESKVRKYIFLRLSNVGSKRRKAVFLCEDHGEYVANCHDYFLGKGCPSCVKNNLKDDEYMISGFRSSRVFAEETQFIRSSKKNSVGSMVYWNVDCASCGETYTSTGQHLKQGKQGCSCSTKSIRSAYILQVIDGEQSYIKFGISKNLKRRIQEHKNGTSLEVRILSLWKFGTARDCKAAESCCKKSFQCGVLDRNWWPSGWTETTFSYKLDSLIDTYKRYGGIEIDQSNCR